MHKNNFLKHWAGGLVGHEEGGVQTAIRNNRKSLTKHLKLPKSWVGRARGGWGAAPAESKLHLRLFKLRPKKPLQPTCLIYFALYNMENTNTCTQKYKYKQTQL